MSGVMEYVQVRQLVQHLTEVAVVLCTFKICNYIQNAKIGGSIIVWRLGGFGLISDAEFGFHKIISAVYGFCIVMQLRKIGI